MAALHRQHRPGVGRRVPDCIPARRHRGVHEFFLLNLLGHYGPEAMIAVAVLLLRLVWTAVEVVTAAALICIRERHAAKPQGESAGPGAWTSPFLTPDP